MNRLWEKQWRLFAPNFKAGKAHIDLAEFGILQLYPGPGFGDFSHPTTRLMIELMKPYVKDRPIVDIGCGSGILSLAAAAMGASTVYGYDIDPEAIDHAERNRSLSPHASQITFSLNPPAKAAASTVFLMNMIHSEQAQAWSAIPHLSPKILITSGILSEQEKEYVKQGYVVEKRLQEEGWCGFRMLRKEDLPPQTRYVK